MRGKPLIDGPFEGGVVPLVGRFVLVTGQPVPEGEVARYRFVTRLDAYVFKSIERMNNGAQRQHSDEGS